MWPFSKMKKERDTKLSGAEFMAVVVAATALAFSIGVARWSWLLLDEQIALRLEVEELKARQQQVETQYEFWIERMGKEKDAR